MAHSGPDSLLPLPGFMPDAVSFASRFTLALLLAYFVSFLMQLQAASSAGVCVAIVMQPSSGMAASKAFYRVAGTVLGGVVALVIVSEFPQDRTMLLIAFGAWLGICTYVASLLHDFRSYGAALAGYTVAVIAVLGIDDPASSLLATLNRVAAILIGVVCVALVNSVFTVDSAHDQLCVELRRHLDESRSSALGILGRREALDEATCLQHASDILSLRTLATYATAELADGIKRSRAAEGAITALLAMLSAIRTLSQFLPPAGNVLQPAVETHLRAASHAIQNSLPAPPTAHLPMEPLAALIMERATALAGAHWKAQVWLDATVTGRAAGLPAQVRLRVDPDRVAALLNAVRVMIALGLAAMFCVLGGDRSVGLVIVLMPALIALLGTQANPAAAIDTFLPALPASALLAGVIAFGALPLASGFGPFALAVGPGAFILGLASRHAVIERFGPPSLLFFTLLLAPSNVDAFDFVAFLNLCVHIGIAVGFTALAFRLILPVKPSHRLFRSVGKVAMSLQRTLRHGCPHNHPAHRSQSYDRLSQALAWASAGRTGRRAVLARAYGLAELDAALRRAWSCKDTMDLAAAGLVGSPDTRSGPAGSRADALEQAARALLAWPGVGAVPGAALRVASGLYEAGLLMRQQGRALRRYGILKG